MAQKAYGFQDRKYEKAFQIIQKIKNQLTVFKQPLRDENLNHAIAVFAKLIYRTWTTCRDRGKTK